MSLSELMRGFKLALASIFAFLTTSLLLSCGAKIEQVVKIDELKKRVQRFDLLVIGDGSLAGFDINTLSISRGRFDRQKKQVFGDSLPAYLARYINQITSDRLTGFTNLSLVGSSLLDWLAMLAPELLADRNREQVRDNLRFISMLDGILVRRDSLEEQKTKRTSNFKDPVSIDQLINIEDVLTNNLHGSKALQEHIKSSNMILISLGFNDLFRPLLEQFLTILDTSFERLKEEDKPFVQLNSFVRSFEKIVKELSENYLYLIQSIKRLNPQAEIVILSYPASNLNLLTGIFDSIIRIFSESWTGRIIPTLYQLLNNMLSTVSSNLKLGFISNFNEFLLEKEAKKAKDLLDISLPTLSSEANSQLAKQMLIKLTIDSPLNKRFIEERTSEIAINDYALYLGLNLDDSEDNVTKKLSYASADIGRFKQLILLSEEEKRRLKVLIKQQVQVTKKTEKTTKNHQKTPKNIAFEPFNETYLDILLNTIVASFTYLNIDSLSESFNIRELASNVIKNLHEFVQILKDGARESKKLLPIIKQIRADILSLLEQFKIPGGS